jgi:sec-independent protein translocase protein TatC
MAKKEMKEMSFMEHLEELRWLLVRSTIAVLIGATAAFFISDFIFDNIIFGPTNPNFITYRFFVKLSNYVGFQESICVKNYLL